MRIPLFPFALLALLVTPPALAVDRLDPRDFDTSVAACNDFYQFANGGWLKATPVPSGLPRFNRFTALEQSVQQQSLALVRSLSQADAVAADPALQALLRSAQNEASLQPAREAALGALLPAIAQAEHPEQVLELIGSYHSRGLPVLFGVGAGPGRTLELRANILTLPDPAFYLSQEPAARDWLGRYRGYMETLLSLAGSPDAGTDAAWALDFEARIATAMAASSGLPVELSARDLAKRHPQLQWKSLLKTLGLQRVDRFTVRDEAALAAAAGLLSTAHPVQWRAWLRFRVVHLLAPYLDPAFRDPHDRFIRKALTGEDAAISTEQRALDAAQRLLGDSLALAYVQTQVPDSRQQAAERVVTAVRGALQQAIKNNTRWDAKTRALAEVKLQALEIDWLRPQPADGSKLALSDSNLVGNVLALNRWRIAELAAGRGRANAGSAGALRPQLGYQAEHNRLRLSPALLQPPLFSEQADLPLQFAGLGALVAHELAHGFDLGGASFAANGAAAPWWNEADRAAFHTATDPLVAQYGRYPSIGGRFVDGERTRIENAADLAGLHLAWQALQNLQTDLSLPQQDGLTPAQRFFVGWASLWRENALESTRLQDADQAEQAPPVWRAVGPLAHIAGFAAAFSCPSGSPMLSGASIAVQPWP